MKKNIFYLSISIFFAFLFSVFYLGLDKPNSYVPKNIKVKNFENFTAADLFSTEKIDSNQIIKDNKFTLINIWASWCIPCRREHSILMDLSESTNLNIIGLNYKDKNINAIAFLDELGNPFSKILTDSDGVISISLGAYGVPETFLINNESKIIKKYIGPLTKENNLEIIKLIK